MTDSFEDRVRARAQEIWEEEGRPDGKAEEHWQRASEELHSQENNSEKPSDSQSSSASAATYDGRTAGNVTGKAKPDRTADR